MLNTRLIKLTATALALGQSRFCYAEGISVFGFDWRGDLIFYPLIGAAVLFTVMILFSRTRAATIVPAVLTAICIAPSIVVLLFDDLLKIDTFVGIFALLLAAASPTLFLVSLVVALIRSIAKRTSHSDTRDRAYPH